VGQSAVKAINHPVELPFQLNKKKARLQAASVGKRNPTESFIDFNSVGFLFRWAKSLVLLSGILSLAVASGALRSLLIE
jgi:hypothetical protein